MGYRLAVRTFDFGSKNGGSIPPIPLADMAELADALGLRSDVDRRGGSSPSISSEKERIWVLKKVLELQKVDIN